MPGYYVAHATSPNRGGPIAPITRSAYVAGMIQRLPDWIKKLVPAVVGASLVAWIQGQVWELLKHFVYGSVVDYLKERIGEQGAGLIAEIASYWPALAAAFLIYFVMSVIVGSKSGGGWREAESMSRHRGGLATGQSRVCRATAQFNGMGERYFHRIGRRYRIGGGDSRWKWSAVARVSRLFDVRECAKFCRMVAAHTNRTWRSKGLCKGPAVIHSPSVGSGTPQIGGVLLVGVSQWL